MRVYLDIIFIINFIFDFISLLGTSIVLKRNTKFLRIIIGSLLGELSVLSIFIRFNTIELVLFKIVLSILINIVTFKFNNIRYFCMNIYYFYLIELGLGGLLYMFKNSFNYNIIFELLIGIVFIYVFIKNIKKLKNNYNKYFSIRLDINNNTYKLNAFLDTGNKLKDPYKKRPIILMNNNYLEKNDINKIIVVTGSTGLGYKSWQEEFPKELYLKDRKESIKFSYDYVKKNCDFLYITKTDIGASNKEELFNYQEEIVKGYVEYSIIEDRKEAIKDAIKSSNEGDVIFISGRGNRRVMCDSYDHIRLFKDKEEVEKIIEEMGKEI